MEQNPELLRRRIDRYRGYLRAGVAGALAIRYLRQIADDDDALNRLIGVEDGASPFGAGRRGAFCAAAC